MFRLQSIGIAVAMLCSLLLNGIVNNSDAFEITSLTVSVNDDTGNGSSAYGHVYTDDPYFMVDWYVDGEWVDSSWGHGGTTYASFSSAALTGSLKGEEYTIKAVAWSLNGDDDTSSYDFTVYRPESDRSTQLGVWGSVQLSSISYSNGYISPSGSANASNDGNEWGKSRDIFHRFRHEVNGPGINRVEEDETEGGVSIRLKENNSYYAYIPSHFSIFIGDGVWGQWYTSNVYMRLKVSGEIKVNNPNGGARDIFTEYDWYVPGSAVFELK